MAARLAKLGIESAIDLLFHLPLRYQDRTRIQPVHLLRNGDSAVIQGEVQSCHILFGKRRSLVCKIRDHSGSITIRFFNFSAAQKNSLAVGVSIRCFGEVSLGRGGLELIHPEYHLSDAATIEEPSKYLTAIYPSTEGIHQLRWRHFITEAFKIVSTDHIPELLNPTANSIYETLFALHYPDPSIDLEQLTEGMHPLQRRLAFEELVAQRLSHIHLKKSKQQSPAIPIIEDSLAETQLLSSLGFELTSAQRRVVDELKADLRNPFPMLRLVQGDVGSGKTIVAALCALHCIKQQLQVALMAPTEILAEQHSQSFEQWLKPFGIGVGLLLSKTPAAEKNKLLADVASGSIKMIIGTHALIQDAVQYHSLGLIVIDEQHRFGVNQRKLLKHKRTDNYAVHQLVMSATPIPRTLAMTFYADLDYSIIDELPPGRTTIETVALSNDKRAQVVERVHSACQEGRQVYWVCTLIEESEALQCQAAESTAEELSTSLTNVNVGLIHGRLKAEQKQALMADFKRGKIQLLVATTVIEVGVDVPNASLMIIENPERLGLAQLHQLRGRVGRGTIQSHCVLLYQKPLSKNGRQRIETMRSTHDGFKLAEYDLKMRGPGEVLGVRQSGSILFRLADLERDSDLIEEVVSVSNKIAKNQPAIADALIKRWCPLSANYIDV